MHKKHFTTTIIKLAENKEETEAFMNERAVLKDK